jgi:hypothetical protein
MGLCLRHAWIEPENLPRLRDIVAQEIQATRGRLGGAEENWVNDPAAAVRWQGNRVYLATSSIHARLFLLARCEWMLMDSPTNVHAAWLGTGLGAVADCAAADPKATAANIDALVAKWKESKDPAAATWLVPIAQRIKEMVGDMAPSTIAQDLRTLTRVAMADVSVTPSQALADVRRIVAEIAMPMRHDTRFVLTGSRANTDALLAGFGDTLTGLVAEAAYEHDGRELDGPGVVDRRLRDHQQTSAKPVHYGLVNNTGDSGVFVNSAKAGGYDDLDDATLTAELASRVFGGGGPHGFFMKTWGAGLAYSNGLRENPAESRVNYYAERCPDLVQTMTFVTGLVRDAKSLDDPYLAEYCVANAVAISRESDEYETRTRAAADEIVDGDTPERVARYRKAILALKDRADLWASMKPRIAVMTGRVLPGIGPKSADVEDGVFFVIAPEPMLAKWEKYVKEHEGADQRVVRIYGRDFWIVPQ